ncbi:hypothetical protein GGS23DRAFT_11917 [Durotheca rogersii]|uniref:uncharacterized protein n=1 Tax=Durotheca rogersii TaxID=419775 RepID=UPI00221F2172|nr:uncharacterized protein GGS23DRAFT_11917 [Durotheca rogersii]KAI5868111.1 hypothetical protein GGS23DRAFT_11917 [Durotheca rogersii]
MLTPAGISTWGLFSGYPCPSLVARSSDSNTRLSLSNPPTFQQSTALDSRAAVVRLVPRRCSRQVVSVVVGGGYLHGQRTPPALLDAVSRHPLTACLLPVNPPFFVHRVGRANPGQPLSRARWRLADSVSLSRPVSSPARPYLCIARSRQRRPKKEKQRTASPSLLRRGPASHPLNWAAAYLSSETVRDGEAATAPDRCRTSALSSLSKTGNRSREVGPSPSQPSPR